MLVRPPYAGSKNGRGKRGAGWPAARAGPMEDEPMIYEVRTYTLRPGGAVAEFEERFAKRLPLREKHSKLGAFWHTEFGPLNQVIHVYPYDDLAQRTRVREALAKDTARAQIPSGGEFVVEQEAEIMNPAPFMHPLGSLSFTHIFSLRWERSHNTVHGSEICEMLKPFPQHRRAGFAIAPATHKAPELGNPVYRLPQRGRL